MEDKKNSDYQDEIPDKNNSKQTFEINNRELESISNINNEINDNKGLKIDLTENDIYKENNKIADNKTLEDNRKIELTSKSNINIDKSNIEKTPKDKALVSTQTNSDTVINKSEENSDQGKNEVIKEKTSKDNTLVPTLTNSDTVINKSEENSDQGKNEVIKEKTSKDNTLVPTLTNSDTVINKSEENSDQGKNQMNKENILKDNRKIEVTAKSNTNIDKSIIEKTPKDNALVPTETNSNAATNKLVENIDKANKEISKDKILEENKKVIVTAKSNENINKNNPKELPTPLSVKAKTKPVKELPIEKKPFLEFVNEYLIPEIKNEFKLKGKVVNKINLQKTHRPIAEDICWVIYCEINDTCNFWLSFEKDDISSLKSFSLCKNYEKPSIIESFLIDEKKITLKLIISRILQRLNGQKLIGAN